MPLPTTLVAIKSILGTDPTLTPADRARYMGLFRQNNSPVPVVPKSADIARLVRRSEAAKMLSCSLRMIDKLAATGVLTKRKLPGRKYAAGFLESDIITLITGDTLP